ncbi:MAG: hypothetical protein ACD_20C00169G0004 [uncultured bacterium]|nr:MAG: hypothetical protein ACD_20C00169G0004 [uncultured bacterium]
MNYKDKKRIQIILYFINNLGAMTKLHLIKLIFFADKYFLMSFGRSITDDKHCALPNGPICSETLDIINHDKFCTRETIEYFDSLLKLEENRKISLLNQERINNFKFDAISKVEKNVLDGIINKFKNYKTSEIWEYSHKLKEWIQFADPQTKQVKGSHFIPDVAMLNFDPKRILAEGIDEEDLHNSSLVLNGQL